MTKRKNRKKRKQQASTAKLFKDLWVNKILPKLDNHSLLEFSAASSESREIGLAELFKREGFAKKLQDLKNTGTSMPSTLTHMIDTPATLLTSTESTKLAFTIMYTPLFLIAMYSWFLLDDESFYHEIVLPLINLNEGLPQGYVEAVTILIGIPLLISQTLISKGSYADQRYQELSKDNKSISRMQHHFFGEGLKKKSAAVEKSMFRKFVDTSESAPTNRSGCLIK